MTIKGGETLPTKTSWLRRSLLQAAWAAAAASALAACGLRPRAPGPATDAVAPPFSLIDHRGRDVSLSTLRARGPVVVVFYRGFW